MNHFRKFSRIGSDDPRQRTEHRFRLLWNGEIGLSQQTSRFSDPSLANEPSPPSFVGFTHDPSYAMARLQGWPGLNLLFHQLQPDAMSWVEIARTAERLSIGDRSEKVDGIPCDVLEATGKYGQFRLWLDPQNEYILRKAVVLKKNDDLVLETLGSSPLNVLLKQGESVLPRRVESRSTLDGVKVAKVGDRYFVSESVETVEVFYEDGGKLIDTTRSHWAYSLDPDSESRGVFDWKIPNGQAMFEVDRSGGGVSYEWRDGRPVPVVDRQFLKEMDVSLKKLDLPSRVAVPSDTPSSRTEGKSHDAATTLGLREISYVASFAVENSAKAASSNKSRWIVVAGLGLVLSILLVKKLRPQKTRGPK